MSAAIASGFYALEAPGIDGKKVSLVKYAGKVTLVVNTASECGYTPQYKGLQAIYEKYQKQGFEILAFPSNDFGAQEPGANTEIQQFCELKYHTTFPLFSKDSVKGEQKQAVYKYLTDQAPTRGEVKWNFEKFLIDKSGNIVGRFESKVDPMDPALVAKIEQLLK